jgi:hypothetical protein
MSNKQIKFHQANITVSFSIVDETRSYGIRQAQLNLLMDTDEEWAAAREQIQATMKQLQEQLDADGD